MSNVDDHGLEVIKKAAINLEPPTKRNYALQTVNAQAFGPPALANNFTSELNGLVRTIKYYNGVTLLKTVTITYTDCSYENFSAGVTTP